MATVLRNGIPAGQQVIATYRVSGLRGLSAPAAVRVLARGGQAQISFRRVAGALGYSVVVQLRHGGAQVRHLGAAAAGFTIPVLPSDSGTVTITPLGRFGQRARTARVAIPARPRQIPQLVA